MRPGCPLKIKKRTKSIYSIVVKMKNQGVRFDEVYDKYAIRIILDSTLEQEKADCWKAYSLVTENYSPNPLRLRDWISSPKSNGYESLHTTVMGPDGTMGRSSNTNSQNGRRCWKMVCSALEV